MEQPISRYFDLMLGILPIRVEYLENHWRIGIQPSSNTEGDGNILQHVWCLFDAFHLNPHKATYRKLFLEKRLINTQNWAFIPIDLPQNELGEGFRWKVGTGADEFVVLEDDTIRAAIQIIEEFEVDPSVVMARLVLSET